MCFAANEQGCETDYAIGTANDQTRMYACETCPGCKPTRDDTRRYHDCINLQTVKAVSYKGRGHHNLLRSARCIATGWVTHKIVPITTTTTSGGTLTLTHLTMNGRTTVVSCAEFGTSELDLGSGLHPWAHQNRQKTLRMGPGMESRSKIQWGFGRENLQISQFKDILG